MENSLIHINPTDFETVVKDMPQAYSLSISSHDACLKVGEELLKMARQHGMSDMLDKEIATYIDRSKKTVLKINGLRSPITKLFDRFKGVFTSMENEVDVKNSGSVPYQLQALRNQYAAAKREEEERRMAEELQQKQLEQSRQQYGQDCETEYVDYFNTTLNTRLNHMSNIFAMMTMETCGETEVALRNYPVTLAADWDRGLIHGVRLPLNLSRSELAEIRSSVRARLMRSRFEEEYRFHIEGTRDELIRMLPSKRAELEKIASAAAKDVAEAERMAEQMRAREETEASRREQERREKEEAERKAAEVVRAAAETENLFAQAESQVATYQSKVSVKKKLNLVAPEGILAVLGLWWNGVGVNMTVAELEKEFKKQITYCNKLANDADPTLLDDKGVEYVEEVKAK